MLARIHGADVLLGSATPSLESLYNCRNGKHTLVELHERYHGAANSEVEIIDTKAERKKRGMCGSISRKLADHIRKTIENGHQVMILRSRRSWAPALQCEDCGEIHRCPHCNVGMSLHKDCTYHEIIICHYCGHTETYTGKCLRCGGNLLSMGAGTQKIEEEIRSLFPDARIARLDSDTSQNRNYLTKTIKAFSKGELDILIGTQMVAKGFDFSNLMLVAIIAADAMLGIQDFRADEKAHQLLEQFRGRCGRRESKGLFVIQTAQPEHPVYRNISDSNLSGSDFLMTERKDFNFPPYTRIIEISVKDIYEDRADRMAGKLNISLESALKAADNLPMITGPYAPVVD
jgi:primosomal protein N' (replication factor Y)